MQPVFLEILVLPLDFKIKLGFHKLLVKDFVEVE